MARILGLFHNPLSSGFSKISDPDINLWTARRLAKQPMLQVACAKTLAAKIDRGMITLQELYRFPIAIVCDAARRAEPYELANLLKDEPWGEKLDLTGLDLATRGQLFPGAVKTLLFFYALPKEKRGAFMHMLFGYNKQLFAIARATLACNEVFHQPDDKIMGTLIEVCRKFRLIRTN